MFKSKMKGPKVPSFVEEAKKHEKGETKKMEKMEDKKMGKKMKGMKKGKK